MRSRTNNIVSVSATLELAAKEAPGHAFVFTGASRLHGLVEYHAGTKW